MNKDGSILMRTNKENALANSMTQHEAYADEKIVRQKRWTRGTLK